MIDKIWEIRREIFTWEYTIIEGARPYKLNTVCQALATISKLTLLNNENSFPQFVLMCVLSVQ